MTTVAMPYNRTLLYLFQDRADRERAREELRRVREESIRAAQTAMRRQTETVQRIASLLGEAAADSRAAVDGLISAVEREERER